MTTDTFTSVLGKPKPKARVGFRFEHPIRQDFWEHYQKETGAGWYLDRFVFLFGAGLERLEACLEAWSFLVPPTTDRKIIGYNAYGSILVLEDPDGEDNSVHVLDPYRVTYWSNPNLDFRGLIGYWIPKTAIPHILDNDLYEEWRKQKDQHLGDGAILAPQTPEGLGGTWALANFNEEDIVDFYASRGPVYAQAFKTMGRTSRKTR